MAACDLPFIGPRSAQGDAVMAATFSVITHRVGENGQQAGPELLRVQQLLCRDLMLRDNEISGVWDKATKQAVLDLQEVYGVSKEQRHPWFEPSDPNGVLFRMLKDSAVLLPLPFQKRGAAALTEFFATALKYEVQYAWPPLGKPVRLAWGLADHPDYLIFTNIDNGFDQDNCPVAMNCTSFTNLALSIWLTGNAHHAPYDASQAAGGFTSVASRYGLYYLTNPHLVPHPDLVPPPQPDWTYQPVPLHASQAASTAFHAPAETVHLGAVFGDVYKSTYFYTPEEVLDVVKPFELYYLQWCYLHDVKQRGEIFRSGFGHHDTIMKSVFSLAARCTQAARGGTQDRGRAGELKTDWTKPLPPPLGLWALNLAGAFAGAPLEHSGWRLGAIGRANRASDLPG